MKRYNKFIFILFVTAILSGIATSLEAQDKPKKKKTALIEVKGLVTDNTGKPLSGVTVLSGEGSIINYTDANGKFALKTKANGTLLIEAFGYKDVVINLAKEQPTVIKLQNEDLYASERDIHERADGGKTYQRDLVGTVSKLSMENVLKYPDLQLSNALQGQAAGLIAISGDGGLGYNTSTLYVRGQHNNGTNTALVIIDGIERPIDDVVVQVGEPQQPRGHRPIQRERRAVAGRRPQRILIGHVVGGRQQSHIVHQRLGIGAEPQPERRGHRHL